MADYWSSVPLRRLRHPVDESPVWGLVGTVAWAVVALAVGVPFLLALAVAVPVLALVQWALKPRGASGVISAADRRWLGPSWQRSVLHAVVLLETKPDVENIRNLIASKVVPIYPRLLSIPTGNYWMCDPAFTVERHVFGATCDEAQLTQYVATLLAEGLPPDKPPWELRIMQRHAVLRVHQSLAEGRQIIRVLCQTLADCRVTPEPFTSTKLLFQLMCACILGPLSILCWLFMTSEDCNVFTRKHVWTGARDVAWSAAVPLTQVTHVKLVTRCSTNCVLLAALAGALRNLLQGCGVAQPPDVKVLVPARIGRWSAPVMLTLPVSVEGAVPRLWKLRRSLARLRRSARPAIMYLAALSLLASGPSATSSDILAALMGKASLQFSAVRGPTSDMRIDGTRVLGIYPFHPAPAGVGLSLTSMLYADRLYMTVSTDSSLEPAAGLVLHHMAAQVAQLHSTLLHRRIPGEPRCAVLRRVDVTASPTRELRLRLSCVQEEVTHQLCDGLESDRVSALKQEFAQLLCELRRRKSLLGDAAAVLDDEDMEGAMWRPQRRRALSCSTLRCPGRLVVPSARPASYIDPRSVPATVRRPLSYSESFYTPAVNSQTSVNLPQVFMWNSHGPLTELLQESSIDRAFNDPICYMDEVRTNSFQNIYQAVTSTNPNGSTDIASVLSHTEAISSDDAVNYNDPTLPQSVEARRPLLSSILSSTSGSDVNSAANFYTDVDARCDAALNTERY